jgi:predicted dehydrogenase
MGLKMNVGLVGCGRIADAHLRAWRKVKSARVTAVCDIDEERAAEVAGRWHVPAHYTELENMIRREELAFLSICTPPMTHVEAACTAIGLGVNVVIEKPLAMTTKEVEQILEISRHSKAKSMVISNLLFTHALMKARRILTSSRQDPISVDIYFLKDYNYPPAADQLHWSHKLPGGIISELLFHALYIIRLFLGDLPVKAVYLDKFGRREWMRYDELAVFMGSPEKRASIHASYNSPRYATYVDLYGPKNTIRADLGTGEVYMFRDPGKHWAGKGSEVIQQTFISLESNLRVVPDAFSFHLGVRNVPHELNIRSFVEGSASTDPPVLTLQDAYMLTRTQEEITTRIDSYRDIR